MNSYKVEVGDEVLTFDTEASREELNAYLNTPEGQAELQRQLDERKAAKPDLRDNLKQAAQGIGLSEGAAEFVSDNPVSNFVLGFGEKAGSTIRGVKQMLSDNPDELRRLAHEEKQARKAMASIDEGIGFEDAGEAAFFAAQLALGSGAAQALKAAPTAVAKVGSNLLQKLSTTRGGIATMAAIDETLKGRTADESRSGEAAAAFATTYGVGLLGAPVARFVASKTAGTLGNTLAGVGVERALGGQFGRSAAGIFARRIRDKVILASDARLAEDLLKKQRSVVRQGASSAASAIAAGARADAAAASNAGLGTVIDRGWNELEDLASAFAKASKGQTKLAKGLGVNRFAQAETFKGLLIQNSLDVVKDPTGNMISVVNPKKLVKTWNQIKASPNFQELYMTGKSKKVVQAIEDFVGSATKNPDIAAGLPASKIAQQAAERIAETTNSAIEKLEELKIPEKQKVELKKSLSAPFMAFVGQQLNSNGVTWDDVGQTFSEGKDGVVGFLDWGLTLEELAREFEEQKGQQ
jgi:hypothetical protein